jgi:hypothetical protein
MLRAVKTGGEVRCTRPGTATEAQWVVGLFSCAAGPRRRALPMNAQSRLLEEALMRHGSLHRGGWRGVRP